MKLKDLEYPLNINQDLMDSQVLFLGQAGSHLYGTNNADSDIDIRGVFLAKKDFWIGTKKVEPIRHVTNDLDLVIYDFRKWAWLTFKGNPNVLETLYTPKESIIHESENWLWIRDKMKGLMNQSVFTGYHGYAVAQLKKMIIKHGNKTGRHAILERDGLDTKFVQHGLRLAQQGVELLSTGNITFPRPNAKHLLDVKNGKHYNYGDVDSATKDIEQEIEKLQQCKGHGPLPTKQDLEGINSLFIEIYERLVS